MRRMTAMLVGLTALTVAAWGLGRAFTAEDKSPHAAHATSEMRPLLRRLFRLHLGRGAQYRTTWEPDRCREPGTDPGDKSFANAPLWAMERSSMRSSPSFGPSQCPNWPSQCDGAYAADEALRASASCARSAAVFVGFSGARNDRKSWRLKDFAAGRFPPA